jgi:hypothetical protein
MSALSSLEKKLENVFVKQAPALPDSGKKSLVEWLPWINLFFGVLALYSAYLLWQWVDKINEAVDYVNRLGEAFGVTAPAEVERLSLVVWLSLAVLAAEAVLYILAFPALRARKKSGWDLLFYALLLNVVYGVVVLFTDYGGVGTLLGTLIGSAVGMYLLFQVRSHYKGAAHSKPASHKAE